MSEVEGTPDLTETEQQPPAEEEVEAAAEGTAEETPVEEENVEEVEEVNEEDLEAEEVGAEEDEEEMTVDLDALPKMKVSELKDILKALDLPTSGIKTTLIERIQDHFAEEDKQEEGAGHEVQDEVEETEKLEETDEKELLKEETSAEPAPEFIEVKKPGEEKIELAQTKVTGGETEKTDEEKKKERAEKFGILSDDDKKEQRAAKFSLDTDKSVESKKEERAAKFGIDTAKSLADKKADRAARFGSGNSNAKLSVSSDDKSLDDEKLKKRKARFNLDSEPTAKNAKLVKLSDISEKLKEKIESGSTQVNLSAATLSLEEKKKLRALKFGA